MTAGGLEQALGHRFRDRELLQTALTHRSYGSPHNERLEFLGDAVLNAAIARRLFECFPTLPEGDLSRLRAHLVRQDSLHQQALALALGGFLHLGEGELRSGGQSRDSILADAVEAIIAAVYLDGGLDQARALVRRLLGSRLTTPAAEIRLKDPKTRLQEYLQSIGHALPQYEVVEISGEQHRQRFRVACSTGIVADSDGEGSSRRKAEQAAAQAMLDALDGARP